MALQKHKSNHFKVCYSHSEWDADSSGIFWVGPHILLYLPTCISNQSEFTRIDMYILPGSLKMADCIVRYERKQKGCLGAGELKDSVKDGRPEAHYRIPLEAKGSTLEDWRVWAGKLKSLHWKPGDGDPKILVKTEAPLKKAKQDFILSHFCSFWTDYMPIGWSHLHWVFSWSIWSHPELC